MTTKKIVEVGVGGGRDVEGRPGGQHLKILGIGNIGGLNKIQGLAPLCELCQETLKISHPPIMKPTPHPPLPPQFLVKKFPSLPL